MEQDRGLEISRSFAQDAPVQQPIELEPLGEQSTTPSRGRFRIFAILTALYISLFIAALDQTIVSTAIPTIISQLHSASGYTWIGGAYLLSKAAAMPLWAKFSDIWGRKPIILICLLLFFGSSIICALAHTIIVLIVGRAIQGIGGGGLIQLVTIAISDIFSLRQRSLFLGLTQIIWAVAGGIGPVLGGVLAERVSWRWIFWLNLPLAGTAFVLAVLFLDVHNPRTRIVDGLRAVDWLGSVTMLGLTLMVLLGLNFGGVVAAWSSAKTICLIVFGCLMGLFFILSEKYLATYPIIPMRLFRERSNMAAYAITFIHGFVFFAAEYYLPLYLQAAKLATPTHSGLLILPLVITSALAAAATGALIHATGEYRQLLQAGTVLMTLGVGLFTLLGADTPVPTIVGLEVLTGVGIGLCFQPPNMAVQALVAQHDVAAATGALGFLRNLATSLSVVVGGAVFQNAMATRGGALRRAGDVDAALAAALAGPEAAANVGLIGSIADPRQQLLVRKAFAWSLRNSWILYACVSACGVVVTLFIKRSVLSKEHTETKTGIRSEEEEEEEAVVAN